MFRSRHLLALLLCGVGLLAGSWATPVAAQDGVLTVSVKNDPPGHLFTSGQTINMTVVIANAGPEMAADITTDLATGFGCPVYNTTTKARLTGFGVTEQKITIPDSANYPNGPYRMDVAIKGERAIGAVSTLVGIWSGPATTRNAQFGISYQGPLGEDRTWKDLDLFRMAGVSWLRFPLQGWLPGADLDPMQAAENNLFIQEATRRGFKLLAAFTPELTVDRAVNPVQADKEYRESLTAAVARYEGRIATWELLDVKPDLAYPGLKGVGFQQIARGRLALKEFSKTAQVLFSFEDPFMMNAQELFSYGMPTRGDLLGARYNFSGNPETTEQSIPPAQAYDDLAKLAKVKLKLPKNYQQPFWVTEYGFDATKGDRLPHPVHQGVLISRALVLARVAGIERVFWRHRPGSQYDLPFTTDDGAAEPSLIALRTTLQMLDGATLERDLSLPLMGIRAYLLRYGGTDRGSRPTFRLVAWHEKLPTALTMRTDALSMTVFDPWGNASELKPEAGIALLQLDEYPRFVDLGTTNRMELFPSFVEFHPSRPVLRDNPNAVTAGVVNPDARGNSNTELLMTFMYDGRIFSKNQPLEIRVKSWPDSNVLWTSALTTDPEKVPADRIARFDALVNRDYIYKVSVGLPLIPGKMRKGQVYQVDVDVMAGSRCIGHFSLPVWYGTDRASTPATPAG